MNSNRSGDSKRNNNSNNENNSNNNVAEEKRIINITMGGVRSRLIGPTESYSDGNGSLLSSGQQQHQQNSSSIQKPHFSHQISPHGSIMYGGGSTTGSIGNGSQNNHHIRQPSVRSRPSQPMPDPNELDRRFAKVLASMDLPPDKAKLLKNYDDEKKWDIICDQEMVHAKDPPSHYLTKLRTYLDPKASRSHRKRKIVGESTSTQVLRDLEISLRTNHIEWVKEFLDEGNQGLDALVDYLSFRLQMMLHEQRIQEARCESTERLNSTNGTSNGTGGNGGNINSGTTGGNLPISGTGGTSLSNEISSSITGGNKTDTMKSGLSQYFYNHHHHHQGTNGFLRPSLNDVLDSPSIKRRSRHIAKLNMGASTDDIHVCIMCLRAIMNNKYGFNMVIQHREAINCIALSLIHKSLRTKALVLELLAAICLVKGGHEIILSSFDNFKEVCQETRRFQTLMDYFINYDIFNIDFMVACMQFVNIVVHSVEDMNYRVHLQYEFTALGLDKYLEKLRLTESEELQVQISAYLDNVFDVAALMEDSETKTTVLERVQELEEDLGRAMDHNAEIEREFMCKFAELETDLKEIRSERDELLQLQRQTDEELSTLRKILKQNEQELKNRESMLESKNLELQTLTRSLPRSESGHSNGSLVNGNEQCLISPQDTISTISSSTITSSSAMSSAPPPPPPPPLPKHLSGEIPTPAPPPPPIPPPPPMGDSMNGVLTMPPSLPPSSGSSDFGPNGRGHPKPPPFFPVAGYMPAPDGAMTIKRKVQTKYKLPTLNWLALKPNQVRGTIFNELDDEKLHKQIDFSDFEERFKIGVCGPIANGTSEVDGLNSFPSKRFKKQENVSVLEHTRLRNIAISRRKLDMPIEDVTAAINSLDLKKLSLENVEILQKMVPTDVETKAYKEYIGERKDPNLLTDEDKFMLQLTKVERISSKLSIMNYMGNFFDSLHFISPQIYAITNASNSLKSSRKFKAVLEIVLAFGNYLNSSKRGPAYGFKLQSLDTLLDTKSTDKRISLLSYIVSTVRQKFPDLLNFDGELFCIDKAAQVSLENVVADVHELEKGMEVVRKEVDLRGKGAQIHILKDFLNNSEEKLKKIRQDMKNAQDAFKECVEYFGESPRSADANAFFSLIVRFTRAFKTADQDNEQRRRIEQAAALTASKKESEHVVLRNKVNQKKQQEAVINELKNKTNAVREKKLLQQDEVYNGALEDILLGLKNEPYRRADAVRRSQRRRIDNNRLSRTMEELEV